MALATTPIMLHRRASLISEKAVSSHQRELSVVMQWQVPMSTEVQALATIEDVTGAWQAAQPGLDSYVTEHC